MQHYDFPTRLLDWSHSPLVAAYFATLEGKAAKEPGAIYALNPIMMNSTQGLDYIPMPDRTASIFSAAMVHDVDSPSQHLAVMAPEIDIRMMVQLSTFTIHGEAKALEALPRSDEFLFRFEVPVEAKTSLGGQLWALGIKRQTLFPDLENLSNAILDELGIDPSASS